MKKLFFFALAFVSVHTSSFSQIEDKDGFYQLEPFVISQGYNDAQPGVSFGFTTFKECLQELPTDLEPGSPINGFQNFDEWPETPAKRFKFSFKQPYYLITEGFITVPDDGMYLVELYANGSSRLEIKGQNQTMVLGNGKRTYNSKQKSKVQFKKGVYEFKFEYAQNYDGPNFTWLISKEGEKPSKVPQDWLRTFNKEGISKTDAPYDNKKPTYYGASAAYFKGIHPLFSLEEGVKLHEDPKGNNEEIEADPGFQAEYQLPLEETEAKPIVVWYDGLFYRADLSFAESGLFIPLQKELNKIPLRSDGKVFEYQSKKGWLKLSTPGKNDSLFYLSSAKRYTNGILLSFSEPIVEGYGEHKDDIVFSQKGQLLNLKVKKLYKDKKGESVFVELPDNMPEKFTMTLRRAWIAKSYKQLFNGEVEVIGGTSIKEAYDLKRMLGLEEAPNKLSLFEQNEKFESLFDGKNIFTNWKSYGVDTISKGWKIEESSIAFSEGNGKPGDLVTRKQYGDFVFDMEWKISKGGNSGIFYRGIDDQKKYKAVYFAAAEMQVLDDYCHPDGAIITHRAGSNYDLHTAAYQSALGPMEWNRVRIVAKGDRIQTWLNGIKTADFVINSPDWLKRHQQSKFHKNAWNDYAQIKSGVLGLQDHSDKVWFRNLKIKTLQN